MEVIAINDYGSKLKGHDVLIAGHKTLQNNLLSSYVEKNTGIDSDVTEIKSLVSDRIPKRAAPQLLLVDCDEVSDLSLSDVLGSLNRVYPGSKIALFNVIEDSTEEEMVALPAVKGVFYRYTRESKLTEGIKAIIAGELWLPRHLISRFYVNKGLQLKQGNTNFGLTDREIQIIKQISDGAVNKEIARSLCLSNHTIKTHIYHIYKKIKVSNRTQASNWAKKHLATDS